MAQIRNDIYKYLIINHGQIPNGSRKKVDERQPFLVKSHQVSNPYFVLWGNKPP